MGRGRYIFGKMEEAGKGAAFKVKIADGVWGGSTDRHGWRRSARRLLASSRSQVNLQFVIIRVPNIFQRFLLYLNSSHRKIHI